MNIPKTTKRFCPFCKERTEQKIDIVSTGHKRGALKRGSLVRSKLRNASPGMGNQGKRSRKAIKSWKRKTKTTKKTNIMYTCKECGKSKYRMARRNKRTSKVLQE